VGRVGIEFARARVCVCVSVYVASCNVRWVRELNCIVMKVCCACGCYALGVLR
jgi:hypothetical protein